MERTYKFLQLTLLGLIVGILIILLTQINYWAYDIKMTIRKSVVTQNNEKVRQFLDKKKTTTRLHKTECSAIRNLNWRHKFNFKIG
jgi:hypothetical protein